MGVQLLAPARLLDDRGAAAGEVFLRHPWAIRDLDAELAAGQAAAAAPNSNALTRDGVELAVSASPAALPAGKEAALYVGLFSFSLTGTEASVESWMREGNLPPAHNPLRLWTLFTHQFPGGLVLPDELGDACVGEAFRAEFCARVATCLRVTGAAARGGGLWRVAVPVPFASGYRLEAYLGDATDACRSRPPHANEASAWWAPAVAEHAAASRSGLARHAAFTRFTLLHVSKASWWWGHHARVDPVSCWTDMMGAAVDAGARSLAASAAQYGFAAAAAAPAGLWLEFGVGSGKTTAAIAMRLKSLLGDAAKLHGFDSFRGLPSSWAHTKLNAGTFSTGGIVPEHLVGMTNVQIHVGLFSDTLADLDVFQDAPVAFAHIDVDIYSSAVEVLSRIACQLYPGTVLVFDELVNYIGFELSGEYRAWEYITSSYQISWDYAGLFWQQAVPIVVTDRGKAC